MVYKPQTRNRNMDQNEQYIRATFSFFLSGYPTYIIRDENNQVIAMAMDEPVIKNAQSKIIEKTGKYYEYEKMVMKLEKVE